MLKLILIQSSYATATLTLLVGFCLTGCEPPTKAHPLQFSPSVAPYCDDLKNEVPPAVEATAQLERKGETAYSEDDAKHYQNISLLLQGVDSRLYGVPGKFDGVCQYMEQLWTKPQAVEQAARFLRAHPLADTENFYDDQFRSLDQIPRNYVDTLAGLSRRTLDLNAVCQVGTYQLPLIGVNVFNPEDAKQILVELQRGLFQCTQTWPPSMRDMPWRRRLRHSSSWRDGRGLTIQRPP